MRYYIGVIHKDPESDYGISFPGFACISAGASFEEVMRMGREALRICIEEMLAAGEAVPEPQPIAEVMADPLFAGGEAVLVSVPFDEIARDAARRAA